MTIIEQNMVRLLKALSDPDTRPGPTIGETLIDALFRAQLIVAADRLRHELAYGPR